MALSREKLKIKDRPGSLSCCYSYLLLFYGMALFLHITLVYGYVMAPHKWHLRKVLQYSLNTWVGTCQITRYVVRALHNLQS